MKSTSLLEKKRPNICMNMRIYRRAANALCERRLKAVDTPPLSVASTKRASIHHVEAQCETSSWRLLVLCLLALPRFAHHTLQRETSGSLWSPPRHWPRLTTVCCRVEFRKTKKTKHEDGNHEVEPKAFKKVADGCSFGVCLTLGGQSVAKGSSGSTSLCTQQGCSFSWVSSIYSLLNTIQIHSSIKRLDWQHNIRDSTRSWEPRWENRWLNDLQNVAHFHSHLEETQLKHKKLSFTNKRL